MPYEVRKIGEQHCVYKKGTDKKIGCHDSRSKADAQVAALYAKEREHTTIEEMEAALSTLTPTVATLESELLTLRPRGSRIRLYFQEGELSNDHRVIDIGATNFDRPPPWALRIQRTAPAEGGHANAELAGVLEAFYRDGPTLVIEGRIDLDSEPGSELERLAYDGFLQTWSPDLSDVIVDIEEGVEDEDANITSPVEHLAHIRKATFNGATVVAMPALGSAVFELLDDEGNVIARSPKREVDTAAPHTERIAERVVANGGVTTSGNITIIGEQGPELFIPAASGVVAPMPTFTSPISACATHSDPPADFFTDPVLEQPTRWVEITSDGRVYGHSAVKGECHIGYLDRCVTIDMIADCRGDGNFEYAMGLGYVVTAEGTRVGTGPITIKGGHAPKGLNAVQAMAHYDDPANAVADVVYGMDDHGVWFSGALRSTATEEQVRILRASGVSLDARVIGGKLRYLATCSVNTPGFPKVRLAASAINDDDWEILEMVAVGGRPIPADEDCGCKEHDAIVDSTGRTPNSFTKYGDAISYLAINALESELPPLSE